MRVLVCGGREYDDWHTLDYTLTQAYMDAPTIGDKVDFTIIEGGARGADFLARVWAKFRFLPFEEYPADWNAYGKRAGYLRNKDMITKNIDLVVAFPGGNGTQHMVKTAKEFGVEVMEVSSER